MTSARRTPRHGTSNRDQVVTQWKSLTSLTCSSAENACQSSVIGRRHAPSTASFQRAFAMSGFEPRSSTGHLVVAI